MKSKHHLFQKVNEPQERLKHLILQTDEANARLIGNNIQRRASTKFNHHIHGIDDQSFDQTIQLGSPEPHKRKDEVRRQSTLR